MEKISAVLNFVNQSIENGKYPTGTELHKKFRIYDFDLTIDKIYNKLKIDFLKVPNKSKRMREKVKKSLIEYVTKSVKKGYYPTHREIKRKFNMDLLTYFPDGIKELYRASNIQYKQIENQALKVAKAKDLQRVAVNIMKRGEIDILSVAKPHQKGIDLLLDTPKGKLGIELKAYSEYEKVKKKDIAQLEKYRVGYKLNRVLLFTTTSSIPKQIPSWLKIFTYEKLIKYCDDKEKKILKRIREKSIHIETKDREIRRNKILHYVQQKSKEGICVGYDEILRDLHLSVYSYFKSMDEVYEKSNIRISLFRSRYFKSKHLKEKIRQKLLQEILDFIKNEVGNGHYPSGENIGNAFGVKHIWNYWKVNDLYKMLNIPTYLERKAGTS